MGFSYNGNLNTIYNNANNDYLLWLDNPEKLGYNKYITDVKDLFNQVMNAQQFSYDPQTDRLFQLYKTQLNQQGTRAMQNQMGVAAARTGGYNSSAAQTSAQAQFQGYLDQLSDKAAETYQAALSRYQNEQQNTLNRFNAAREMNESGNDAYWQQVNARQQRANNAYNAYVADRDFQYNQYADNIAQENWKKEYELNKKLYEG